MRRGAHLLEEALTITFNSLSLRIGQRRERFGATSAQGGIGIQNKRIVSGTTGYLFVKRHRQELLHYLAHAVEKRIASACAPIDGLAVSKELIRVETD